MPQTATGATPATAFDEVDLVDSAVGRIVDHDICLSTDVVDDAASIV